MLQSILTERAELKETDSASLHAMERKQGRS